MSDTPKAPQKSPFATGDTLPETVAELEEGLALLAAETKEWQDYIKALSAHENVANGVFHHEELHAARQYKMQLGYRVACCKAKINRLCI